jgi:hypothetical protein
MGFFEMMNGPGAWAMWMLYGAVGGTWIVVVCLAAWALRAASRSASGPAPEHESAIEVLERRYAAGEIEEAEFRRRKLALSGAALVAHSDGGPTLHLVTQTRSAREITDLDWGPHSVA